MRKTISGWWFQTFFIFHNICDNPSHWLIFLRWFKPPTRYKWYKRLIFSTAMFDYGRVSHSVSICGTGFCRLSEAVISNESDQKIASSLSAIVFVIIWVDFCSSCVACVYWYVFTHIYIYVLYIYIYTYTYTHIYILGILIYNTFTRPYNA